ncbi:hypothetical protein NP233_g5880 [Leucocoprinus birnbaumii]|uniref:Uncharacterized protein n=1 Tax=Leucocoprinus birnbaumii TaxID=56174 RepID=A0AAD5VVI3_9AGAR|nr:hypothetical protein NP233_g5880 [Leucocoprinus birnbaumii]
MNPRERPSRFGRDEQKGEPVPAARPRPQKETDPSNSGHRKSRRLSIFRKSRNLTAEKVVDRSKSIRDQERQQEEAELYQSLLAEQHEMMKRIAHLNNELQQKSTTLQSLKERDEEEKWEDELFNTRLKELNNARTVIDTRSSVSGEAVRDQVKVLNREIARTAELVAEAPITTQRPPIQLEGMPYLRKNITLIFEKAGNRLNNQKVVQAMVQIFLAEACMRLIDSWHLEKKNLDALLRDMYNRISGKEEQTVAGKWRQITFSQVPHGQTELLQKYSKEITRQVSDICSAAGWEGDATRIQRHIRKVMEEAEKIRESIKGGMISADLQPWIAGYCGRYDEYEMKDASESLGLARLERGEVGHVWGSTELGLRANKIGDEQDLKNARVRPRVVLLESLGFQFSPSRSSKR